MDYRNEEYLQQAMRHINQARICLQSISGLEDQRDYYNLERSVVALYEAYDWLRRA